MLITEFLSSTSYLGCFCRSILQPVTQGTAHEKVSKQTVYIDQPHMPCWSSKVSHDLAVALTYPALIWQASCMLCGCNMTRPHAYMWLLAVLIASSASEFRATATVEQQEPDPRRRCGQIPVGAQLQGPAPDPRLKVTPLSSQGPVSSPEPQTTPAGPPLQA